MKRSQKATGLTSITDTLGDVFATSFLEMFPLLAFILAGLLAIVMFGFRLRRE
jgi:hypothetical protein